MAARGATTGKPTAAPAVWPYLDHRTVADWTPGYWREAKRQAQSDHVHALLARGLDQYAVAARMGLSPGRISHIVCQARRESLQQRAQDLTNGARLDQFAKDRSGNGHDLSVVHGERT